MCRSVYNNKERILQFHIFIHTFRKSLDVIFTAFIKQFVCIELSVVFSNKRLVCSPVPIACDNGFIALGIVYYRISDRAGAARRRAGCNVHIWHMRAECVFFYHLKIFRDSGERRICSKIFGFERAQRFVHRIKYDEVSAVVKQRSNSSIYYLISTFPFCHLLCFARNSENFIGKVKFSSVCFSKNQFFHIIPSHLAP